MVKIRLRRMGAKKQPTYRFVVCDAKSPRDGAFIEILGHYNPRTDPKTVVVNEEKVKQWLAKGAQPSDPVRRLFAELGLVPRGFVPPKKVVAPPPEAAAPAAAPAAPAAAVEAAPVAAAPVAAAPEAAAPEAAAPAEAAE
jgi:small subunit ribosomal protein S16